MLQRSVGPVGTGARGPDEGHVFAASDAHASLQAVKAVQLPYALPVDGPPFAAQHHPDAQVAEPRARVGDFSDAEPQRTLVPRATRLVPGRATALRQTTGPHAADGKGLLEPLRQLAAT
jgi:hypothetical protein